MNRASVQLRLNRFPSAIAAACVLIFAIACSSPQPKHETTNTTHTTNDVINKTTTHTSAETSSTTSTVSPTGKKLVSLAEKALGSPYKYGGSSLKGFDCSGLVYYTHSKLGISVPRTTRAQASRANTLNMRDIQPGDILFFRIYGDGISHVGIYAGDNRFIHAPKTGKFVSYASIDDPFWRERLIKAGRLH